MSGSNLTPKEITQELDKYIVGQREAKRAVAVALRNRWRRMNIKDKEMRKEILPKNILMIGQTGVGKTEICRRLAKLVDAPFLKVDATTFTEVGYVGRDVEQIIRYLLNSAIKLLRDGQREKHREYAVPRAEKKILEALLAASSAATDKDSLENALKNCKLEDKQVEVKVMETPAKTLDLSDMRQGGMGIDLSGMIGQIMGGKKERVRRLKISEAREVFINQEVENLIDEDTLIQEAISLTEESGIVFIDEIDKVCSASEGGKISPNVSREGVQRDLLPLVEGAQVQTKHGLVNTEHILFIASGAFQGAKPSDLLPELQGRFPVRAALDPLTEKDFELILTEPKANLIRQYKALMEVEGISLKFTKDAVSTVAALAAKINSSVENIGARRLHTIMELVTESISFHSSESKVTIDGKYVEENCAKLLHNKDLSRFIL